MIDASKNPGARVVLLGEPGCGKAFLAEQAARELATPGGDGFFVEVFLDPPHPASGVASVFSLDHPDAAVPGQPPAVTAASILERLLLRADGLPIVLVARDIDEYSALDAQVLEVLARDPELRIIATARRLSSAAERAWHGPAVRRIPIGPFTIEESEQYLASMLRVDRIEAATLRQWHQASGGFPYALEAIALACERSGAPRRSRGTAWSADDGEEAPGEFAERLLSACSKSERETLEIVALAEPISENALLRMIDAAALASLFEQGLIRSRSRDGGTALVTGRPLLAASLRAGITPMRRLQLNDRIFRVLDKDRGTLDPVRLPERLMRLVVFGLEGGHDVPLPWLWSAFELAMRTGDPRLVLRLALAVAAHRDAEPVQAGVAAVQAGRLARVLGDDERLRISIWMIEEQLGDADRLARLSLAQQVSLRGTLIRQRAWDNDDIDEVLGQLDAADRELDAAGPGLSAVDPDPSAEGDSDTDPDRDGDGEAGDDASRQLAEAREAVRSNRALVLAYSGRLREAAAVAPPEQLSPDVKIEWIRSPARAVAALIMLQQGVLGAAVASAEHARMLSQLGARERVDSIDVQGFCWLLGAWVSGNGEHARQVLAELEESTLVSTHAEMRYSGLVEAGAVLLDVQAGRWQGAAQRAERLLVRLQRHDCYGIAPLVHAAAAYACAVLGEREAAQRALRAASIETRGIGQALAGYRRLLMLRANQWLRHTYAMEEARALAEWARAEELPLIELQALHSIVFAVRGASADELQRARELAAAVDAPVGGAFVAHIERIVDGAVPGNDDPEVRLLAELGTWLPYSPVPDLTAREHEVVLFASLGYSSKFIAERLHISVRTVETHLSNIFAKLGIENRDELRQWAARTRTEMLLPRSR